MCYEVHCERQLRPRATEHNMAAPSSVGMLVISMIICSISALDVAQGRGEGVARPSGAPRGDAAEPLAALREALGAKGSSLGDSHAPGGSIADIINGGWGDESGDAGEGLREAMKLFGGDDSGAAGEVKRRLLESMGALTGGGAADSVEVGDMRLMDELRGTLGSQGGGFGDMAEIDVAELLGGAAPNFASAGTAKAGLEEIVDSGQQLTDALQEMASLGDLDAADGEGEGEGEGAARSTAEKATDEAAPEGGDSLTDARAMLEALATQMDDAASDNDVPDEVRKVARKVIEDPKNAAMLRDIAAQAGEVTPDVSEALEAAVRAASAEFDVDEKCVACMSSMEAVALRWLELARMRTMVSALRVKCLLLAADSRLGPLGCRRRAPLVPRKSWSNRRCCETLPRACAVLTARSACGPTCARPAQSCCATRTCSTPRCADSRSRRARLSSRRGSRSTCVSRWPVCATASRCWQRLAKIAAATAARPCASSRSRRGGRTTKTRPASHR